MMRDWRSDAKPPTLHSEKWHSEINARLKKIDDGLCERCKANVLDSLCPSCVEIMAREVASQEE